MNRSGNQNYSEEDQGDDQHGSPSQANVSYDQRNSNSREEGSAHDQSYQASTRHNPNVEPAQLESIKDIVSKLSSTEAKINSLKADLHTRFTKIETNQKDVKDFSEVLLDQIRKNPISRKPGLDQDIQQGVEAAIVESGATIHRLKKENADLKETIKTKNRYIENIQENYRNLKKAFDEKAAENEKLKQALEQRDHELVQHKRKEDNEYKVNAMRENIRATRNEQGGYMQKREEQQHYGDGIRDDYDFWKTTNDNAPQDVDRDSRGKGKLDNLFQGQNKLFIQDKNAVGGINFDNLKLSSQQPRCFRCFEVNYNCDE